MFMHQVNECSIWRRTHFVKVKLDIGHVDKFSNRRVRFG